MTSPKNPWQKLLSEAIANKCALARPEGFFTIREIMAQTGKSKTHAEKLMVRMIKIGKVEKRRIQFVTKLGDERVLRTGNAFKILS